MENKEKKNNKRYYPRKKNKRKVHKKANKKPVNIRVYGYCRQRGISCFYAFINDKTYFWIPVSTVLKDSDKLYVAIFVSDKDDKFKYDHIESYSVHDEYTKFSDMIKRLINDGIDSYKGFEYNYGRKKLYYENIKNFVEIINN